MLKTEHKVEKKVVI